MTPEPSEEALAQLRLRYRLAASAADAYVAAGFTVVLEDVVAGSDLGELRTASRSRPCHVVVLFPTREAVSARESGRADRGYREWTVGQLHDEFAAQTPRVGVWLDTTALSPGEAVDAVLASTAAASSPVVVVDYDASWLALFEELARPVRAALAHLGAGVEHVGSTAVPGLAAKPVVDIDVVVPSPADVPAAIEGLRTLGYVHQGDKGIAGREAFLWSPDSVPHHLYVVAADSQPLADHLAFRDYLRRNPEAAREYAALKRALAERHGEDRLGYTNAKSEFVAGALRAAEH